MHGITLLSEVLHSSDGSSLCPSRVGRVLEFRPPRYPHPWTGQNWGVDNEAPEPSRCAKHANKLHMQCKCTACAERDLQMHDVSGLPKRSLAGALSSQGCAASLILEADGRYGSRSACSAIDCPQARHGSTTPWAECGRTFILETEGPAERHPVVDGILLRNGPVQGRHAHPS